MSLRKALRVAGFALVLWLLFAAGVLKSSPLVAAACVLILVLVAT